MPDKKVIIVLDEETKEFIKDVVWYYGFFFTCPLIIVIGAGFLVLAILTR